MPSAEILSPESRFLAMFVGPTKCGKTVAACSFRSSEDKVIQVMDFDGRIRGLLGAPWINRKNINYTYYPPKQSNLIDTINKELEMLEVYAEKQPYNLPETIILDSITSETITMLTQSVSLTHSKDGKKTTGRYIGNFAMPEPGDYGYQSQVTMSIINFLLTIPVKNIIVTGHVVPIYGKKDEDNPYSETIVVGERISITDKLGSNIGIKFDHCFRFDKKEVAYGKVAHVVRFRDKDLANTAYASLPDQADWTGKNLYHDIILPKVRETK
jgi:hypothetical protein